MYDIQQPIDWQAFGLSRSQVTTCLLPLHAALRTGAETGLGVLATAPATTGTALQQIQDDSAFRVREAAGNNLSCWWNADHPVFTYPPREGFATPLDGTDFHFNIRLRPANTPDSNEGGFIHSRPYLRLYEVGVNQKRLRRQGIGIALVQFAIDLAQLAGLAEIIICPANQGSRFWPSCGSLPLKLAWQNVRDIQYRLDRIKTSNENEVVHEWLDRLNAQQGCLTIDPLLIREMALDRRMIMHGVRCCDFLLDDTTRNGFHHIALDDIATCELLQQRGLRFAPPSKVASSAHKAVPARLRA